MVSDQEKRDDTASDLFVDPLSGMIEPPAAGPAGVILDEAGAETGTGLDEVSIRIADGGETQAPAETTGSAEEVAAAAASDVNAMIDSALPESVVTAEPAAPANETDREPGGANFFELTLRGLGDSHTRDAALAIMKKFGGAALPSDFEARATDLGAYRLTRISEFHAYALAAQLYRAGVEFQIGMPQFGSEDSAPELVPEIATSPAIESSGAVAVPLPTNPGEILLATLGEVPGYRAAQSKGIVTAHGAIARAFFREEEREERLKNKIQALQPGAGPVMRGQLPRAEVDKVFQGLLERLQREAFRRGANGVIGVQVSGFSESTSFNPDADQIRLIASGTAVLLEPAK